MASPKIIITGGLGFIFSHVTEHFVKKGWEVIVVDNQSAGSHPEIIDDSFEYHKRKINTFPEKRLGMDMKYQTDASRIREELGWEPLYSFDEGLKQYLLEA
ncbi:MAG: NAD-dependent epimerase/dehydratase family protein [Patescibacteria group bacterium]